MLLCHMHRLRGVVVITFRLHDSVPKSSPVQSRAESVVLIFASFHRQIVKKDDCNRLSMLASITLSRKEEKNDVTSS
jgi:hypothetical protein